MQFFNFRQKIKILVFIALCTIFVSCASDNKNRYNGYNNNLYPGSTSFVNPYEIPQSPYPDQDQYYQPPSTIDNSDQSSIWDYK